ncbi:hypothetical protein [Brachybacterium huguangmaarense]
MALPAVFLTVEAHRLGIAPTRLRALDVERLARGIHRRLDRPLTEAAIAAALCRADPRVVVSHATAARLQGLPTPSHWPAQADVPAGTRATPIDATGAAGAPAPSVPIDVTLPPGSSRRRSPLMRVRTSTVPPRHVDRIAGVRVTSRVRIVLDLAPSVPEAWLVVLADHLVRRPRERFEQRTEPYATLNELRDGARAMGSRRGAATMRRALERARVGSDSPQETALRLALIGAGLPEPVLNVAIADARGDRVAGPDLQWPRFRVAAEYEGPHHRTREQLDRDIDRADAMRRAGWVEVRVTARDAREGWWAAIQRVRRALQERGWEG